MFYIDIDIKNMPKVSQYKSYRMVKNKIKNIPKKLKEKIDIINFKDLEDELPGDFEIDRKKIKEICSAFNSNNIIF